MHAINSYVIITIYLVVFLAVSVAVFQWRQSQAVRRRVRRMMLTFGIDEATARNADALLDLDMRAVRRRCRQCPEPDTCERWLNGETVPGNGFCPNAPQFAAVAPARQCCMNYDPRHKPGRRLDA